MSEHDWIKTWKPAPTVQPLPPITKEEGAKLEAQQPSFAWYCDECGHRNAGHNRTCVRCGGQADGMEVEG